MLDISNFFKRVQGTILAEVHTREVIVKAIERSIGIALSVNDIEFKRKVIRVKASPIIKNQLFIKKAAILEEIKKNLPNSIVTDLN